MYKQNCDNSVNLTNTFLFCKMMLSSHQLIYKLINLQKTLLFYRSKDTMFEENEN